MQLPVARFTIYRFGGYDVAAVDDLVDRINAAAAEDPPSISGDEIASAQLPVTRFRGYSCQDVDAWLDQAVGALPRNDVEDVAPPEPPEPSPAPLLPLGARPRPVPNNPGGVPSPVPSPAPESRRGSLRETQVGVVRAHRGVPRWLGMTSVALVATALIVVLYLAGAFSG